MGSASGNVYALQGTTGEVVSTVNVGSGVPRRTSRNVSQPLTGMAIGHAHLLVPGTHTLISYGSQPLR